MDLVQNLRRMLEDSVNRILVAISSHYIKQRAKSISKKRDNSSFTMSSPSRLTMEHQHTTMVTSSRDTIEKTTMEKSSEEIFNHIRDWAKDTIANKNGALETYNRLALIDEFYEWFENDIRNLEVVSLDEITEDQYNNLVDPD
jgi:hypothetical protein